MKAVALWLAVFAMTGGAAYAEPAQDLAVQQEYLVNAINEAAGASGVVLQEDVLPHQEGYPHILVITASGAEVKIATDGYYSFNGRSPVRGALKPGDRLVHPDDGWGEFLELVRIDQDGAVFSYALSGDPSGAGDISRSAPEEIKVLWRNDKGADHGQD